MWRLLKLVLVLGTVVIGILVGVAFVSSNPTEVNVVFPFVGRESGVKPLGLALLVAGAVGMGIALLAVVVTSIGAAFYAARLKRDIRNLKKEVDALRNLPLLEEEVGPGGEGEGEDAELEDSEVLPTHHSLEVASGPVRGGSTAAHVGGDDEEEDSHPGEEEAEEEEENEDEEPKQISPAPASVVPPAGTRKIDVP